MTLFYLVRHAAHARQDDGTLVGRTPGIGLGPAAPAQLRWLRERLAGLTFDAVLSGPLPRAVETARAVAREPTVAPELDEVDYGDWTRRSMVELADDLVWRAWNRERAVTRVPGGETMAQVQARAVGLMDRLARSHPDGRVLLVSHGDVIRAALLHVLGLPLDLFLRVEVEPGSLSAVGWASWGGRVLRLGETAGLPTEA